MRTQSRRVKEIQVLLHDIRSTHNVGSIFRTSDAVGVSKIYLSGTSPMPIDKFGRMRKDIAKVALGAEKNIPWEEIKDSVKFIKKMKKLNFKIVALEQNKNSINYKKVPKSNKVLFIVGNEVWGISKKILDLADFIAEIPMRGGKESLNVSVAFGIGVYALG